MKEDRGPSAATKVMDSLREAIIKLTEDRKSDASRPAQPAARTSETAKRAPKKAHSSAKV